MRAYELMVIFDGDLDESTVQGGINRIHAQVEEAGGLTATTDKWGQRRFAYEINHKHVGFYVVLEILAEPGALDRMETTPAARGRRRPPQAHPPPRQGGRTPRPHRLEAAPAEAGA